MDKRILLSIVLLVAALLGVGCGGAQPAPSCNLPSALQMTVEGSDRVNVDGTGRSLPTIVRIYQLKDITAVETAEFEDIWLKPEETLGESLLGMDEVTIYPRERVQRAFERNPEANFVVGIALFRQPAGATWRSVLELPPPPAEQACAARAEDPEAEPGPPPNPHVAFLLEDYRIEGTLELIAPEEESGCATGTCGVEGAVDAVGNAPAPPEAPAAPAAPEAPAAPSAPESPVSGKVLR